MRRWDRHQEAIPFGPFGVGYCREFPHRLEEAVEIGEAPLYVFNFPRITWSTNIPPGQLSIYDVSVLRVSMISYCA